MRSNASGGTTDGTCPSNQAVTPSTSMPSVSCGVAMVLQLGAACGRGWAKPTRAPASAIPAAERGGPGMSLAAPPLERPMIDVTDATFEADVLNRSHETPVVVDLWAPWCGPCRQLGPILETVVDGTEGQVVLAKVNVDENPEVSKAFQVQGIPAVYAVSGGKVVDGFVGAQGEAAVQEFVAKLLPTEEENEVAALLEAGDEASLRRVLEIEADHAEATVALAELLVGR